MSTSLSASYQQPSHVVNSFHERGPHPATTSRPGRRTAASRLRFQPQALVPRPQSAAALPVSTPPAACRWTAPTVACRATTYEDLEFYLDTGIYDIPQITEPNAFWQLCDRTKAHAQAELTAIAALPRGQHVVERLDALMLIISAVALPAAHCSQHHQDAGWREAATAALGEMHKLATDIINDPDLFQALADSLPLIPGEHRGQDVRTAAERLLLEYRRRGTAARVGLRAEQALLQMQELRLLRMQEEKLSMQLMRLKYSREDAPTSVVRPKAQQHEVERRVADRVAIRRLKQRGGPGGGGSGGGGSSQFLHLMPLTADLVRYFLEEHPEPDFRRGVYQTAVGGVRPQMLEIMDGVRLLRQRLAATCGFPSYAHFALQGTLAGSPGAAQHLLEEVLAVVADAAKEGVVDLRLLKRRLGPEASGGGEPKGYPPVHPWDVDWLSSTMVGLRTQADDWWQEAAAYLQQDGLLLGLQRLLDAFFGLEVEEWEVDANEEFAPGVRRFMLAWADGGVLGDVYLDPQPNPEAGSGCVLVRNGRQPGGSGAEAVCHPAVCISGVGGDMTHPLQVCVLGRMLGHALYLLAAARGRMAALQNDQAPPELEEAACSLLQLLLQLPAALVHLGAHPDSGDRLPLPLAECLAIYFQEYFSPLKLQEYTLLSLADLQLHLQPVSPTASPAAVPTAAALAGPSPSTQAPPPALPQQPAAAATGSLPVQDAAGAAAAPSSSAAGQAEAGQAAAGQAEAEGEASATGLSSGGSGGGQGAESRASLEIWDGIWEQWSSVRAGGARSYMAADSYSVEDLLANGARVYKLVYGRCLAALLLRRWAELGLDKEHGRKLIQHVMAVGPARTPAVLAHTLVAEGLLAEGDLVPYNCGEAAGYVPAITTDVLLQMPNVAVEEDRRGGKLPRA